MHLQEECEMHIVFIDSNIYLRFFDNAQPEYKKLLTTVLEVKSSIFITDQIVAEVNRNKLAVFQATCNDSLADSVLTNRHLPEHFDSSTNKVITEWNKKRKELQESSKKLVKEQDDIFHSILTQISTSTDEVSKALEPLFASAKTASTEEIEAAEHRKRRGNPPGKVQDSLGDQISWEQLLMQVTEANGIWIITNDLDYLTEHRDKCYFNPYLLAELTNAAKQKPAIRCFNKLADGLRDFNSQLTTKLTSLPTEKVLDEISKKELFPTLSGLQYASGSVPVGSLSGFSGSQGSIGRFAPLSQCPFCASRGTVIGPITAYIGTGALAYQYICNNCGRNWEIVEPNE